MNAERIINVQSGTNIQKVTNIVKEALQYSKILVAKETNEIPFLSNDRNIYKVIFRTEDEKKEKMATDLFWETFQNRVNETYDLLLKDDFEYIIVEERKDDKRTRASTKRESGRRSEGKPTLSRNTKSLSKG